MTDFPSSAPSANPVFCRTYSRKTDNGRESWSQVVERNLSGLAKLGKLNQEQVELLRRMQLEHKALPSGRWLWVGGTKWLDKPENVSGAYNCTSTNLVDWRAFALMMDLAMMGCGTGAIIEPRMIDMLPIIRNKLNVTVTGEFGQAASDPETSVDYRTEYLDKDHTPTPIVLIEVGDSRKGWVDAYYTMFQLASDASIPALYGENVEVAVVVDISKVRPSGEPLKGFGGTANPVKLKDLFVKMARIFNKAQGRKLTSVECCLLTDEAALVVVAGNVRRCLPEDALVHTERGLVPIKDVNVGEYVQTPIGFKRVLNKFDQGVQEVIEIETNSMNPRATAKHEVAVFSSALGDHKWKKVSSLESGDRLLHSDQILTGGVTHLPVDQTAERPAQSRTAKNIVIPDLDIDIAWLIGYTHGNGYVSLGRNKHDKPYGAVSWSMNGKVEYTELKEKLQKKINNALAKFGVQATHSTIKGENTAISRCCSIRLAEYFYEHIKKPGTELVVPSFILQGSADVRMAYLAGLVDSDGAINNKPPHLVTTVYGKFARQVGAVLSSIGIAGRIAITTPKEKNWKPKYNITIPAFKKKYNQTIAALSVKGKLKEGLRMNGFTLPNTMMRETYNCQEMSSMGFSPSTKINTNVESYIEQSGVDIDIPVTVKGLGSIDYVQTYDIEVEDAHCFYCDGYLTHNSAGIRQFSANDTEASIAKDNLWQQDEDGNWRIDPERDALRMANHTLVYHHYPTKEEIVDSVRRQFLSGEGAIMFAPEAIARANCDILTDKQMRQDFISAYCDHKQSGAEMLKDLDPDCVEDSDKLEHRMGRYGINPCFAPGTMVMTRDGHYPIESLVGKTVEIHDGEKWVEIDNFRITGVNQNIFRVCLGIGRTHSISIKATEYHTFVLSNDEELQLKDLKPGMKLKVNKTVNERINGLERVKAAKVIAIYPAGVSEKVYCCTVPGSHRLTLSNGVIVGNCGEIEGNNFHCNLAEVHLNQILPSDRLGQKEAFTAAGLSVAALLHHRFQEPRYQYSRELDPIVGVSFTGLFDFFVEAFGVAWLQWWEAGRPNTDAGIAFKEAEAVYLSSWRKIVEDTIRKYCDHHGLKCPNRMTTCQPAGCLDRNALRVFDQGLLYADEIVNPGSGETTSLPLSVRDGIGATTAIANAPLDLVRLKFANGRELRMTPDHRLSVQGSWIRADHMEPGMLVDYQLGVYQRKYESLLVPVDAARYSREARINEVGHGRGVVAKTIAMPLAMSEDLAYFIGAMYGNGCMSENKYRVRFSHERIDVLHRLSAIGLSLFGLKGFINAATRSAELPAGGALELCFASRQLFDWFKLNRLDKHAKSFDIDRIPEAIRRSSRSSILAFFAGLIDCDGCARNHTFSIDTASEKFMRNLQQVGEAVGLCLGLSHNTKGSNYQGVKSMWSLSLSRMKSHLDSVNTLNNLSIKLKEKPTRPPARQFSFEPYRIVEVITEQGNPDYTFDFAIEGVDDDDSWYWQGALKSHNTKSLLTGASPGWHPPKAQRFIRRITFRKNDPVALACMDFGYTIVPSQSDKDEVGRLLDDPFDPRCTEWLVEIPTEVKWANMPGADRIKISQFSALAQFDFYMQVQTYYTRHNTSATIEFREHEIEPLATAIHEAIMGGKGYISAALLARFDANETFPRLPFEPIDKATYDRLHEDVLQRRKSDDFFALLRAYDSGSLVEAGPAGCDSDKCLLPQAKK